MTGDPLMELRGLRKVYDVRRNAGSAASEIIAVDHVDLAVHGGETLAIVGESGSGKTTLARLLLRLEEPSSGSVVFEGVDLSHMSKSGLRALRKQMQVVLQDPYSSMNPRMRVVDIIGEPLVTHRPEMRGRAARTKLRQAVDDLLDNVELPVAVRDRYPHELSGGQRQRISVARALALKPQLVVLDEPTSALDVSVQAQVLELLGDLQRKFALTYVLISHDLAVVRNVADRVAVMHDGQITEIGEAAEVFHNPETEYTKRLLEAIPNPDPAKARKRRVA